MMSMSVRMTLGDAGEFRHFERQKHDRYARLLRGRPEPVRSSVREPGRLRAEKRDADAEHARLIFPCGKKIGRFGVRQRDAAHDAESIGIDACGFERVVHPIAFPGWRDDDDTIDARLVHQRQQLVVGERFRKLRPCCRGGRPWAVWCIRLPQVDLRIDDESAPVTGRRLSHCTSPKRQSCARAEHAIKEATP
jgi:hypothetical protein